MFRRARRARACVGGGGLRGRLPEKALDEKKKRFVSASFRELVSRRKIAKSDLARFVTTSELLTLSTDLRSAAHRRARSPP